MKAFRTTNRGVSMISRNNLSQKFQALMDEISSKMVENTGVAKDKVTEFIEQGLPPVQSDAVIATLNGMVGDSLEQRDSRFAQKMQFRDQQQTLSNDPALLPLQLPDATDRIILCVHGWCMNDVQWLRKEHDHGRFMATFGYTPIYLRYNTGMHISANGEEFALKLEALLAAWPCAVTELVIVGHSMGGLVTRSACYYGKKHDVDWLDKLTTFITLGTPHNGAPLAKLASWVDERIADAPYLKVLSKVAEIRSSGTRDLSHGFICHSDWQQDEETRKILKKRPTLPQGVACYAIASCLGNNFYDEKSQMLGDGLVPVSSALGDAETGHIGLDYPPKHKWIGEGINHLDLLSHPLIMSKIKEWILDNTIQPFDLREDPLRSGC